MPASPARTLAADLINAVLLDKRSLSQALAACRQGRPPLPDARTLAAAQSLAYGVLRHAGRLRFFLNTLSGRPLDPAALLGPMLLGLFELDSASSPAYAAVNETVELVAERFPRARGFANAILRNFQRHRTELEEQAAEDPRAHWNFPNWWQKRLQDCYPDTWQNILGQLNTHPPMTLRVNRRQISGTDYAALLAQHGMTCRQHGDSALTLDQPVPVSELPHFAQGWVSVQDLGAQWAAPFLDCADGMMVLDACAAPGGKTAHVLERHDVRMTALDNDAERLRQVTQTLERLHLHATTVCADAGRPQTWWQGEPFDRILLDAPCTASGVVRRHPDGKWLKRPEDMPHLAREQARLLESLWPLLKAGGKMLYATCSLFPAENSEQISAFLARHPEARIEPCALPDGMALPVGQQLLPGPDTDGFFYARLVKT